MSRRSAGWSVAEARSSERLSTESPSRPPYLRKTIPLHQRHHRLTRAGPAASKARSPTRRRLPDNGDPEAGQFGAQKLVDLLVDKVNKINADRALITFRGKAQDLHLPERKTIESAHRDVRRTWRIIPAFPEDSIVVNPFERQDEPGIRHRRPGGRKACASSIIDGRPSVYNIAVSKAAVQHGRNGPQLRESMGSDRRSPASV